MNPHHGSNIVILGLARQGTALARYLVQAGARVTVSDIKPAEALAGAIGQLADLPIEYALGGHPLSLLDRAHLLCLSGGVPADLPIVAEARRRGIPVSNDSQIFLEVTPATVIGITGSAGKTTTTSLVGRMADGGWPMADGRWPMTDGRWRMADGKAKSKTGQDLASDRLPATSDRFPAAGGQRPANRVFVGGNIGNPLIAEVAEMRPGDLVVMELSSFQLDAMTRSPQIAAVLNITPNHLDRHGSMQAYSAAKAHILTHQGPEGTAVLGLDDEGARALTPLVRGRRLYFSLAAEPGQALAGVEWDEGAFLRYDRVMIRAGGHEETVCRTGDIRLRGAHNVANVLAACAISAAAGIPPEAMRAAILDFAGVAHRLEFVRDWGGARWYNDSIATAPERSIAAIRSFDERLVLLAGGRDKKLPWEEFAALVRSRVDHLILFGEAAELIERAMSAAAGERPFTLTRVRTLADAVELAARVAAPGDVVLLSPGGTSFDEFDDFAARGETFKRLVHSL